MEMHPQAQGFLAGNTLWVVATPSEWRVDYAQQVAEFGRLAVEKPPAATARQARLLLPLAHSGAAVYPMAPTAFTLPDSTSHSAVARVSSSAVTESAVASR